MLFANTLHGKNRPHGTQMPKYPGSAPALAAVAANLFDYAGLYPPAALPATEAVEEYIRLLSAPEASFVGPFVVDALRLEVVASEYASKRPGARFQVSLLAGTRRPLQEDVDTATTLLAAADFATVSVVQVETVWPTSTQHPEKQLDEVLRALSPLAARRVFLEVSPDAPDLAHLATAVAASAAAMTAVRDQGSRDTPPLAGLKIRCGGPAPSDIPSVEDVDHFLRTCALHGAPFKATAGLHHPVRAYHEDFGGFQHGFLNVFLAALLLSTDTRRDPAAIIALLNETDADAFVIEPDTIGWRDLRVALPSIQRGRAGFAMSIGSCSIAEPVADLRALGWL